MTDKPAKPYFGAFLYLPALYCQQTILMRNAAKTILLV